MSPLRLPAAVLALALAAAAAAETGAVVAADGTGQFRTVQAAIDAAPQLARTSPPWIIRIKAGLYREIVYVQREKRGVRLVGEDPARTTIAYDLRASQAGNDGRPIGTFRTPTLWIDADDFSVENLTVANTAGPPAGPGGQALALRADGDRVAFRHCRFLGWQDTVLGNRGRHYYRDCLVAGAVDFIFGAAAEYYESCEIRCLGRGYITAASTPAGQAYGFVFDRCRITAADPQARIYLGRPWRDFASVTFLRTEMAAVVRPEGWHNWSRPDRERTARFAEFGSTGPGADPGRRVAWARRLSPAEAAAITVKSVLGGWDPDEAEPADPLRR